MQPLIIQALAVWYISYAITNTHGIFGVFVFIREHDPIHLTTCIVCTALWVSVAISVLMAVGGVGSLGVVETIAAAGLAMLVHKYSGWGY